LNIFNQISLINPTIKYSNSKYYGTTKRKCSETLIHELTLLKKSTKDVRVACVIKVDSGIQVAN